MREIVSQSHSVLLMSGTLQPPEAYGQILFGVQQDVRTITVECQSFCPKIVTVFMSAFKSTDQVLAGESDNGDQDKSGRIL